MPKPVRTMLSIQATPDTENIRTAELMGQEHTVIPCIALVEGVLHPANAPAPELALAEEFGRFPAGWDGRPVVYDHPKVDGVPVPANSPDVLQTNAFGQLFNTKLEDKKLKTEIWINTSRLEELDDDAREKAEELIAGETIVEVSTGLFTMQEPVTGEYDGDEYHSVWRNIVPDHLAVLPNGVRGACSVEDGAGAPRLNQEMTGCMRAAQLSTLAEDDAAIIDGEDDEGQVGLFKKLMNIAGSLFNFASNSSGLSDGDIRAALYAGLNTLSEEYYYILAVFQDTFVYEKGWDGSLYESSYTVGEDGSIKLGGEHTPVRPVTSFVPVSIEGGTMINSTSQENAMSKEKLVNELIANEATQYGEDEREWLMTLEEDQLTKMAPITVNNDDDDDGSEPAATVEPAQPNKPVTTNEYIAEAPKEIRDMLESGVKLHREKKAALVKALTSNSRCKFTEDQLNAKDIQELEFLAELATDISFEGAGANFTTQSISEDEGFTPAPTLFTPKSADGE